MTAEPSDFMVLVPDEFGGLAVVSVSDLHDGLGPDANLGDLLTDHSIDSIDRPDLGDAARERVGRLYRLNETGDAAAYWSMS